MTIGKTKALTIRTFVSEVMSLFFNTSLVLLFSSLWVAYSASKEFDFIVIVSLLPSCCGFFVFGHGVSFLCVRVLASSCR